MRITEAARRLDMTARMLRYRESLGLLPVVRHGAGRSGGAYRLSAVRAVAAGTRPIWPAEPAGQHRQFSESDLAAVALGLSIERRYDISPAALAFGIRVLADPRVRAEVADFGRRIGHIQPPPARALDFEQERAQRLLRLDQRPTPDAASGRFGQSRRPGSTALPLSTATQPKAPEGSQPGRMAAHLVMAAVRA